MTDYDFAIIYFGLTRSTKKVYESHIENIFNILRKNNLKYKTFIHTWKTKDSRQVVWDKYISQAINYEEYKNLDPDFYKIDEQEEFIDKIDMKKFFYQHLWDKFGDNRKKGEWFPYLIKNHLCALESQKRCLEMVEEFVSEGNKFKYTIFIRPDVKINSILPLKEILDNSCEIILPDFDHYEGYNDRFAILPYEMSHIYGKRINELEEFRRKEGRIVSEKIVKYIVSKYKFRIKFINFNFNIIRP